MAADEMSTLPEIADVCRAQESVFPDPIGSHEKVTPPAERFQQIGNMRMSAEAAIVEREERRSGIAATEV